MDVLEPIHLIIAIVGGLLFWGLLELFGYIQGRLIFKSVMARVKHPERFTDKPLQKLDPESQFIVRISDDGISCDRPDGKSESVSWADLQRIEILNTEDGPWFPDQFWVLHGADRGAVIPFGATGGSELLERLQELPGFDNSAVIGSASSTNNESRICWQRTG